jgi:hypothetical protein
MAGNLTTFMCRLSCNLGASTSWNPQGLSRPVMGLLYLYLLLFECKSDVTVNFSSCSFFIQDILVFIRRKIPLIVIGRNTDVIFLEHSETQNQKRYNFRVFVMKQKVRLQVLRYLFVGGNTFEGFFFKFRRKNVTFFF